MREWGTDGCRKLHERVAKAVGGLFTGAALSAIHPRSTASPTTGGRPRLSPNLASASQPILSWTGLLASTRTHAVEMGRSRQVTGRPGDDEQDFGATEGSAPTRRFVEGMLAVEPDGTHVLRTADGEEPVHIVDGSDVGLGSTELWVLTCRDGELALAHLDPHAFRKRRAAEKRSAKWKALRWSDSHPPDEAVACTRCGRRRVKGAFPPVGTECFACWKPQKARKEPTPPSGPDDRAPSTSVRTVRGGLPGHGRRR